VLLAQRVNPTLEVAVRSCEVHRGFLIVVEYRKLAKSGVRIGQNGNRIGRSAEAEGLVGKPLLQERNQVVRDHVGLPMNASRIGATLLIAISSPTVLVLRQGVNPFCWPANVLVVRGR
ncbi:MAG TPA: hypothetical protein VMT52_06540, partial [Planctomycetota bacterium]|nr:hypothetical protein [Planctomycetota bacterium]